MARIIWHESAREHLRAIFSYYINNVSQKVAYSILNNLLAGIETLGRTPRKGAIEELLQNRQYEYRHLVVKRIYKVIYFVDNDECHIVAIWDTRQKPSTLVTKMRKRIK